MDRETLDYIMEFLVYVSSMYRDINPYLKGFHLALYILRSFKDENVLQIRGEEL